MTLIEFLLARIVEDEKRAHGFRSSHGVLITDDFGIYDGYGQLVDRALAECQAKRELIDRYVNTTFDNWAEPDHEYENWILPALAVPYQDHPDYQESWRVVPS